MYPGLVPITLKSGRDAFMFLLKKGENRRALGLALVRLVVGGMLALGYALAFDAGVFGQNGPQSCNWSKPVNLSETPDQHSLNGVMVGDPSGYVHALWTERTEAEVGEITNYIVYRHWDGAAWSPAVDILLSTGFANALVNDAVLTQDGSRLYTVWTDGSGVNVSWADRQGASNAAAWATRRVAHGGMIRPSLTIDDRDALHVLYVDDFVSLRHIVSADGGDTWSSPITVWDTRRRDRAIEYPDIIVDDSGIIHAAWSVGEKEHKWLPFSVRYTRSVDGRKGWEMPIEFRSYERGYADPAIFEHSSDGLYLVWNGAVGTLDGRFFARSDDRGNSWSPVQQITGYFGGARSGYPRMVEDSSGILHVLTAVQGQKPTMGGVQSFTLIGDKWGPPALVPAHKAGDAPAFAITSGNQLHAMVWTQDEPAEILHSTCLVDAPPVTPVPTATPRVLLTPTTALSSPTLPVETPPTVGEENPPRVTMEFEGTDLPINSAPVAPAVVGIALAGAVVAAALGFIVLRSGRRL